MPAIWPESCRFSDKNMSCSTPGLADKGTGPGQMAKAGLTRESVEATAALLETPGEGGIWECAFCEEAFSPPLGQSFLRVHPASSPST